MLLSVVIPTRDRAPILRRCLESLQRQTLSPQRFEVIVVDDGSADSTPALCREWSSRLPNFRYCRTQAPGLHNGRHAGMRLAQSDLLVYGDDDIEALPTWLEGVNEAFRDPRVVLVGGPAVPLFESPPPPWFDALKRPSEGGWWLGPYSLIDLGPTPREIPPRLVFGCNFSIRKGLLHDLGGFHPDAMPKAQIRFRGDGETAVSDAVAARGFKALYHPAAAVGHLVSSARLTLEYLDWRAYIQGISDSYALVRQAGGISLRTRASAWTRGRRALWRASRGPREADPWGIGRTQLRGYWRGFNYHQREVWRDAELLAWVLKPDYLGESK